MPVPDLSDLGQAAGWGWLEVALGPGEHTEHDEACGTVVEVLDGGQLVPDHLVCLPGRTRDEPWASRQTLPRQG